MLDSQLIWLIYVQAEMMFGELLTREVVLILSGVGLGCVLLPLAVIWFRREQSIQDLAESLGER